VKLVNHRVLTALIVQVVRVLLRQRHYEVTIFRGDRLRVIPLEVVRLLERPLVFIIGLVKITYPVVEIDCFPIWIVAWPECSSWGVELIGEDQLHVRPTIPGGFGEHVLWGISVDEAHVTRYFWYLITQMTFELQKLEKNYKTYLSACIDPTKVETALI
jgi:hypothetical protein